MASAWHPASGEVKRRELGAPPLAEQGFVQPLASRGIVAQVNSGAVIYDAETTSGGSGGPVLDDRGRVIAVNAAILPEFGGSNIGVPVTLLHQLLADSFD